MVCPNCGEKMNKFQVDEQEVWHCLNCGGNFFKENGINRITVKTAQTLAQDTRKAFISDKDKVCPIDSVVLQPSTNVENVPSDVVLLRCPKCKGVFSFPDDLVNFKKAQEAKLEYFKLWKIPLPSIQTIAYLSIIIFVGVASFTMFTLWQQQNISRIQAQDMIRNLYITTSRRYLFISFRTLIPLRSRVVFTDVTTNQIIEKPISMEPTNFHQLTTTEVNIEDDIYYQITLTDQRGNETKTEIKKLQLN